MDEKKLNIKPESRYKNIKRREDYIRMLNSGMFWELFPELNGVYGDDIGIILNN